MSNENWFSRLFGKGSRQERSHPRPSRKNWLNKGVAPARAGAL